MTEPRKYRPVRTVKGVWSPRQRHVWMHNSMLGTTRAMEIQLARVIQSESADDKAKEIARRMFSDVTLLYSALKNNRIDPWKE